MFVGRLERMFVGQEGATQPYADSVAYGPVTVETGCFFIVLSGIQHTVDQTVMAADAVVLQNRRVSFLDANRLLEVLESESLGVVVAVFGLGDPLIQTALGQVAVDTTGHRVMTRLLPGVELGLHDVAVDTGLRILAEVGQAFGVVKGEGSCPNEHCHEETEGKKNDFHSVSSRWRSLGSGLDLLSEVMTMPICCTKDNGISSVRV